MPVAELSPLVTSVPDQDGIPPLRDGDVLSRAEFLRRWEAMPELRRAERIEGVVHLMPSPVAIREHAFLDSDLGGLLWTYRSATLGTCSFANGTVFLDFDNDFQPDQALIVLPEHGGQTQWSGKYLRGAPEFVAEIAHTSAARDRGVKKTIYRRNGVLEYLIWRSADAAIECFALDDGAFRLVEPADGIWRSAAFPGLWLNLNALLANDAAAARATLEEGLRTPEHAAFAAELARRAGNVQRANSP